MVLRRPKKELDDETSCVLPTVQGLCDRRSASILVAAAVLVSYVAFGHLMSSGLLAAVAKSAVAFSLGILCSAALPESTEEPELGPCPYSKEFWEECPVKEEPEVNMNQETWTSLEIRDRFNVFHKEIAVYNCLWTSLNEV